ncbi:MAG: nucleotidyltransferase domain-containing protein [Muribaculaceae bacterium]|nr:nucleotidyltransferase domain-containing protein [Muribaculaceae bacterium]
MNNIGLTEKEIAEVISYMADNPKISRAIIFGSRAKGNYKPFSDVDLSLVGDNLNYSDLERIEEKLYYSYLPYIFDINIYSELKNKALIDHIDRVGIEIYSGD